MKTQYISEVPFEVPFSKGCSIFDSERDCIRYERICKPKHDDFTLSDVIESIDECIGKDDNYVDFLDGKGETDDTYNGTKLEYLAKELRFADIFKSDFKNYLDGCGTDTFIMEVVNELTKSDTYDVRCAVVKHKDDICKIYLEYIDSLELTCLGVDFLYDIKLKYLEKFWHFYNDENTEN